MHEINNKSLSIARFSLLIIAIIFCAEIFGNHFYSYSQDLENHISLASYILSSRDIGIAPYMGSYPPLSHYLAAIATPIIGNLLASFTKVSVITTLMAYYIIFTCAIKYSVSHAFISFCLLIASLHYGLSIIGGEVIGNSYFFPQLVASFLAINIIYIIINEYNFNNKIVFYSVLFLGIAIGCFVHPTAVIITAGAYLVKISSVAFLSKYASKKLWMHVVLISIIMFLLVIAIPYNRSMANLALHNGGLSFGFLANLYDLSYFGYIFIVTSILLSAICIFYYALNYEKTNFSSNYKLILASVLCSGSIISLMHVFLTYIGKSTFYAVKKNFFFNFTFLCILCSIIIADLINKHVPVRSIRFIPTVNRYYYWLLALIMSIFIVQILYRGKPTASVLALDAIGRDCIKLQESKGLEARQKTIVQLPIDNVFNYLLTSCYLNFPNRQILWDILFGRIDLNLRDFKKLGDSPMQRSGFEYIVSSSTDLLPPAPASGTPFNFKGLKIQKNVDYIDEFLTPPAISPGEVMKMNTKKNILVFQSGIANAEPWGTWSDGPKTRLQIKVIDPNELNRLILSIQPFIHGARSQFEAYAEINGRKKSLGYFAAANSGAQPIEIPFYKSDLDSSSNLTVDFYYTNTMPAFKASGLNSGDSRLLSFGFIDIMMPGPLTPSQRYNHNASSTLHFINWSYPERAHRWSLGKSCSIEFNIETPDEFQGEMILEGYSYGQQKIDFLLNNTILKSCDMDGSRSFTSLLFSKSLLKHGSNRLTLLIPGAQRPDNGDLREVGYAFCSIIIK